MQFTDRQLESEARRLYTKLKHVKWSMDECRVYAPMTLEINALKKEKDAIILAHSYQTPDIIYGVADFVGDSYGLSIEATKVKAKTIVFCSVHFMAETAKILNPSKEVLVPRIAGCSLASSITKEDVLNLKKNHPGVPVVCYVNTSAQVKAVSDVCVTSANVMKIIEKIDSDEIIFIPDKLMAKNIQAFTKKKIIAWDGVCIVHEKFSPENVDQVREMYPGVKVLAHTECSPAVVRKVDMAGGTTDMINYLNKSTAKKFMLATECGMVDRMNVEMSGKKFVGACSLCPYMKEIQMKDILNVLKSPTKEQIIILSQSDLIGASKSLKRMLELS